MSIWGQNLTGRRFGALRVLGAETRPRHAELWWVCRCDCGARVSFTAPRLMGGSVKDCGCVAEKQRRRSEFTRKPIWQAPPLGAHQAIEHYLRGYRPQLKEAV